jgi:DNA repair protein RecN (Recombination protein N)
LKKVMKKHGGDLDAVLAAQAELRAERSLLESATERITHLEREVQVKVDAAAMIAARLSAVRTDAAVRLGTAIERELPALGMPNARVLVVVEPLPAGEGALKSADGRALSQSGADRVELRFSANAGEAPAPLAKVASGGELSRVLLAVKRVLLDNDPVPVSVFDEVDAGVGGAIGEAIGEKLEAIAGQKRQVLCITHLPQIACRGESHLVVSKAVDEGRTVSRVRLLDDVAREGELARMLGGREITATTLSHAKEMLARAREARDAARALPATTTPTPTTTPSTKKPRKGARAGAEA